MVGGQESESGLSNRSPKPKIGTEVWGSSRPLTKVRGAEWIPIGFGRDDLHPQRPTGWKLVEKIKPPKKTKQNTRPDFKVNESTTDLLSGIVKSRGKGWWGNYNADLTEPDEDK